MGSTCWLRVLTFRYLHKLSVYVHRHSGCVPAAPLNGYRKGISSHSDTCSCQVVSWHVRLFPTTGQPGLFTLQDHYVKTQAGHHGRGYQCS